MANFRLTNKTQSILDMSPMKDVLGNALTLKPMGTEGSVLEVDGTTVISDIVQRVRRCNWIDVQASIDYEAPDVVFIQEPVSVVAARAEVAVEVTVGSVVPRDAEQVGVVEQTLEPTEDSTAFPVIPPAEAPQTRSYKRKNQG